MSEEELANDPAAQQLTNASEEAQKVARNEGSVRACVHNVFKIAVYSLSCLLCCGELFTSMRCRQHGMCTDASRELTMPDSQWHDCLRLL